MKEDCYYGKGGIGKSTTTQNTIAAHRNQPQIRYRLRHSPNHADEYRKIAEVIDENQVFVIPKPLATEEMEALL